MYKLRKFYIDNVGSGQLDFENLTLNFLDNETNIPVNDAIVFGDNGGGKTTILSMFFTLLKPHKEKFIQRLQRGNHHFDEYVKRNPGLILAEFSRYDETSVETHILGQYVYIKPDDTTHRDFFYIPSSIGHDFFECIPSFGRKTLHKKEDIRSFLNETKSCFYTQDQSDWQAKLEEIGFDYKQIEAQISFCESEGGIDTFADFKSEHDFLNKFYELTMMNQGVDEVRKQISNVIKQNQQFPLFEKQVNQLSELIAVIKNFTAHASVAGQQKTAMQSLMSQANGYLTYVENQIKNITEEEEKEVEKLQKMKEEISLLRNKIASSESLHNMTKLNCKQKELAEILVNINATKNAKSYSEHQDKIMMLAPYYLDYKEAADFFNQKRELFEQLTNDLEPLRDQIYNLKMHAAKITKNKIDALKKKSLKIEDRNKELDKINLAISDEINSLTKKANNEELILLRINDFFKELKEEKTKLEERGIIDSTTDINVKLVKLSSLINDYKFKNSHAQDRLMAQKKAIKDQQVIHSSLQNQLRNKSNLLSKLQTSNDAYADELSKIKAQIMEYLSLDDCYPYSDEIYETLFKLLNSLMTSEETLSLETQKLIFERNSIVSSNGLVIDEQVSILKSQLEDNGIQSLFALDYVNEICNQDVDVVANIVNSNPSKFLGLMVYKQETIDSIKGIVGNLNIKKPVVVSMVDIQEKEVESDSIVVSPFSKKLYSPVETARYIEQLNNEILVNSTKIKDKKHSIDECKRIIDRIDLFKSKHPETDVNQRKKAIINVENEIQQIEQDIEQSLISYGKIESFINQIEGEISLVKQQIIEKEKEFVEISLFNDKFQKNEGAKRKDKDASTQKKRDFNDTKALRVNEYEKNRVAIRLNETDLIKTNQELMQSEKTYGAFSVSDDKLMMFSFEPELLTASSEHIQVMYENIEKELERKSNDAGYGIKEAEIKNLENKKNQCNNVFLSQIGDIDKDHIILACENKTREDFLSLRNKEQERGKILIKELTSLENKQSLIKDELFTLENELYNDEDYKKTLVFNHEQLQLNLISIRSDIDSYTHDEAILIANKHAIEKSIPELNAKKNKLNLPLARLMSLVDKNNRVAVAELYIDLNDSDKIIEQLSENIAFADKKRSDADNKARNEYLQFSDVVRKDEFKETNKDILGICSINYDCLLEKGEVLQENLLARIDVLKDKINDANTNISQAVSALRSKVKVGLRRLRDASNIHLPPSSAMLSGLNVIKLTDTARKVVMMEDTSIDRVLDFFVKSHIRDNTYPQHLLVDAITELARSISRQTTLGIKILQIREGRYDYYLIDDIKSSGGERLTTALLLYVTVCALSGKHGQIGGFLFTDNIFGKCCKSEFVNVQLQLAKALKFQLISTTGLNDKSFMSQYSKILSIKPMLKQDNTGRVVNSQSVFDGLYFIDDEI